MRYIRLSSYNSMFIDKRMPESKAFLSLNTAAAIKVLMIFHQKRRIAKHGRKGREQYEITNNGELVFTYLEADKKYGIKTGQFKRAIDELINKGFLEVTETGMGLQKTPTLYSLCDRWLKYGTDSFQPATRPEPKQYNMGFKPQNTEWKKGVKTKTTAMNRH